MVSLEEVIKCGFVFNLSLVQNQTCTDEGFYFVIFTIRFAFVLSPDELHSQTLHEGVDFVFPVVLDTARSLQKKREKRKNPQHLIQSTKDI